MAIITRMTTLTSSGLMQLMWLASPALPVGGFSYSEGLESAVDKGLVTSEDSAKPWLQDQLHLSLARSDLVIIAKAIKAWRENHLDVVAQLNNWILQTRETSELRAQTEQMGRSLLEWLRNHTTASSDQIESLSTLQPTYPVAFALAASCCEASVLDCLTAYAFGWAENMVQAAIKSVPLGQSAGQRILSALTAEIPNAVQDALALAIKDDLGSIQAFSPMLAILSAQHETQYSRLFRS